MKKHIFVVCLLVIISATALTGCGNKKQNAIDTAYELISDGKYDEARSTVDSVFDRFGEDDKLSMEAAGIMEYCLFVSYVESEYDKIKAAQDYTSDINWQKKLTELQKYSSYVNRDLSYTIEDFETILETEPEISSFTEEFENWCDESIALKDLDLDAETDYNSVYSKIDDFENRYIRLNSDYMSFTGKSFEEKYSSELTYNGGESQITSELNEMKSALNELSNRGFFSDNASNKDDIVIQANVGIFENVASVVYIIATRMTLQTNDFHILDDVYNVNSRIERMHEVLKDNYYRKE